jgi:hypothetical protein
VLAVEDIGPILASDSVAAMAFVPDGFEVPRALDGDGFRLRPLGPEHTESDLAAWSSSIAHVLDTPGFAGWGWPPVEGMSADANRADLEAHARDFAARTGFTYTVLAPDADEVLGCVYVYPPRDGQPVDAVVRSWVRADVAELDRVLWETVSAWLRDAWPFERVGYAAR